MIQYGIKGSKGVIALNDHLTRDEAERAVRTYRRIAPRAGAVLALREVGEWRTEEQQY